MNVVWVLQILKVNLYIKNVVWVLQILKVNLYIKDTEENLKMCPTLNIFYCHKKKDKWIRHKL